MSKTVFEGKFLKITHTLEETGPHPSVLQDYYDDCFSVTAILQGSGSCFVEGNRYSLKTNDMILLGVDEIRSFRFCQEGCHERISIYFTASLLSPFWECELPLLTPFYAHTPGAGNKCSAAGENREHALSILNRIRDIVETVETQPGTVSMPEARLSLLTVQLLFCLYDAFQTQDVPNSKLETDSLIREICRYIRDNLNEKLTYEHLQDRLFVSRYQLTEIFRRNTGMSLAGYILQKRLTKVISLVRNGVGIEHAAYQAGFKTYANFYKEFKKHKGISPQKYFADEKKHLPINQNNDQRKEHIMAEHFNHYELKQFAKTVADCMDFPLPEAYAPGIGWVSALLKERLKGTADRVLLYHADAVGLYIWQKYTDLFSPVYRHSSIAVPYVSTVESVTPVAHASMYTGLDPSGHGILTYTRPRLTCDTLYDRLIEAGKKVAIIAMPDSTFLHIFTGRDLDYFEEEKPTDILKRALELIQSDRYDVISIHTFEYDNQAHAHGPESPEALAAASEEAEGFARIAEAAAAFSGKHRTLLAYAPDHGQHLTDANGRPGGAHGSTLTEDMNVLHFYGTVI